MNAKGKRFTMEAIAEAAGLPISTVRRHVREGLLDIYDLRVVARYVVGHQLVERSGHVHGKTA